MLLRQGVPVSELEGAAGRVAAAVDRVFTDDRGRWILSNGHRDSRCEVPVTAVIEGQVRHLVIDRTFVDENDVRWIIDYKTGTHEGGNLEKFLDEEQDRYGRQLANYAAAFRKLEEREIRTALYYPLIDGGWRVLES